MTCPQVIRHIGIIVGSLAIYVLHAHLWCQTTVVTAASLTDKISDGVLEPQEITLNTPLESIQGQLHLFTLSIMADWYGFKQMVNFPTHAYDSI